MEFRTVALIGAGCPGLYHRTSERGQVFDTAGSGCEASHGDRDVFRNAHSDGKGTGCSHALQ